MLRPTTPRRGDGADLCAMPSRTPHQVGRSARGVLAPRRLRHQPATGAVMRDLITRGKLCARGLHDEWVTYESRPDRSTCHPCMIAAQRDWWRRRRDGNDRPEWARALRIYSVTFEALEWLVANGPMAHDTLADDIGAQAETVRRALYRLAERGVVHRNDGGLWWAEPSLDFEWLT